MKELSIEEKELLLKDLCTRLPYGIKIWYKYYPTNITEEFATSIRLSDNKLALSRRLDKEGDWYPIEEAGEILIKPYLRPMSSMTEEEFTILKKYSGLEYDNLDLTSFQNDTHKCLDFYLSEIPSYVVILVFDWLNAHHFDYRGLIETGLALEAKEEMYNLNKK